VGREKERGREGEEKEVKRGRQGRGREGEREREILRLEPVPKQCKCYIDRSRTTRPAAWSISVYVTLGYIYQCTPGSQIETRKTYLRCQNRNCPILRLASALSSRNLESAQSRKGSYFKTCTSCRRYWDSSSSLKETKDRAAQEKDPSLSNQQMVTMATPGSFGLGCCVLPSLYCYNITRKAKDMVGGEEDQNRCMGFLPNEFNRYN
jgi:hypothetical protein